MPSPIGHLAVGYALSRTASPYFPELTTRWKRLLFLGVVLFISMAPDLDALVGMLRDDLGRYHNQFSHSLSMGLVAALAAGSAGRICFGRGFARWRGLGLIAYSLHVVMDAVTLGRGVRLFWPVTSERFQSPLLLFYGLHWSNGLVSWQHLVTLANEIPIAATVIWLAHRRRGEAVISHQ